MRKSLGDDVVAVYAMGSGAIPGMAGSPMVDILLAMKNSPPTDAQVKSICKSYHDDLCLKIQLNSKYKCSLKAMNVDVEKCFSF